MGRSAPRAGCPGQSSRRVGPAADIRRAWSRGTARLVASLLIVLSSDPLACAATHGCMSALCQLREICQYRLTDESFMSLFDSAYGQDNPGGIDKSASTRISQLDWEDAHNVTSRPRPDQICWSKCRSRRQPARSNATGDLSRNVLNNTALLRYLRSTVNVPGCQAPEA